MSLSESYDTDDWGPLSGLPGNPIMWLLIASELFVFGAFFVGFSLLHITEPELFSQSQNKLDRLAGGLNTMVLVTSGLFAALAVHYQRQRNTLKTRLWLTGAGFLGVIFLIIKWTEYADKFNQGLSPDSNSFFMWYFLCTGFHAMHVIFGIFLLIVIGWKNTDENILTGTAFWHMVDLIWVIMFPVIYLIR